MVSTRSSGRQTRSDAKATATDTPSKEPSTTNGLREARTSTATGPTAASNSKKRKSVENAATKPPAKRAKAEKTKPANTIVKRGRGRPARSGKGNPRRQVMLEEVVLDPKGRNRRKKEEGEEEGEEGDTKIDSPTKKEDDHNEQDAKEQSRDSEGDGAKEAGREEPVDEKKQDANDHSVEESKEAESGIEVTSEQKTKDKKSTILEKGLIYFFFRPRVQTENPSSLKDVQRSYMVLLPLPEGAILNEEPVKGDGKYRLMAIPKKKLPGAGKHERFL